MSLTGSGGSDEVGPGSAFWSRALGATRFRVPRRMDGARARFEEGLKARAEKSRL